MTRTQFADIVLGVFGCGLLLSFIVGLVISLIRALWVDPWMWLPLGMIPAAVLIVAIWFQQRET